MILIKIEAEISPPKQVEFEQAIRFIIDAKINDKAKHHCRVFQNIHKNNTFIYMEEWDNEAAIRDYMDTDGFKSLIGSMKVLGEITSAELIDSEKKKNVMNIIK